MGREQPSRTNRKRLTLGSCGWVIYAEWRKETNCGKAGQKKQNEEKFVQRKEYAQR